MKFEEAFKELNTDKKARIWHEQWGKIAFIMTDLMMPDIYHLTLWDSLAKSNIDGIKFKGQDERLYFIIGSMKSHALVDHETAIENAKILIMQYYGHAQYSIRMIGYRFEDRKLKDGLWEVI